jgi:uncharacterized protein YfaS (alpha-2-macroglobulin family)
MDARNRPTSRALPLLYLSDLGDGAGGDDADTIRKRINDAITRLVAYQSASGSFGLWGPGSGDLWLDAYVTDFLTRAMEKGFSVPPVASRWRSTICRTPWPIPPM